MYQIMTSPTRNEEWLVMMHAILGRSPEHKVYPEIDSRLHVVRCKTEDVSGESDRILHQVRASLTVDDAESYAVLLYRLDELGMWLGNEELIEVGESLFMDLLDGLANDDEVDRDWWLNEWPRFDQCPDCKSTEIEVQDQSYLCWECGWIGNYHSEWPYLHDGMEYVGRLDQWVAARLESSYDDEIGHSETDFI